MKSPWMKVLIGAILAALALSFWFIASDDSSIDGNIVQIRTHVDKNDLVITVINESSSQVRVLDFSVDDTTGSGYRVFLYDQRSGELFKPVAIYQLPPGAPINRLRDNAKRFAIPPHGKVIFRMSVTDLLGFFDTNSECNFVVIMYSEKDGRGVISSLPSEPTLICGSVVPALPPSVMPDD